MPEAPSTGPTEAVPLPFVPYPRPIESRDVSPEVAAATLAALRGARPERLHALFRRFGGPVGALAAVQAGRAQAALPHDRRGPELARLWATADPGAMAKALNARHTRVYVSGEPDFPFEPALEDAPAVLFAEGDSPEVLSRPRVAVVGTRTASPAGIADARAIGRYLAEQGITVVSGLALGIDGAAHLGALEAGGGVIGVVATGLDVVYPRRHHALFARVRRSGLVMSEHTFGVQPSQWRFPIRNRIIAGVSDATVVVEATATGGARITANWAAKYQRDVLAVPGSRRNPAAAGCNELIRDGAHPLLDPSDITSILGFATPASGCTEAAATAGRQVGWGEPRQRVSPGARRLLGLMAGEPATLDQLVGRSGASLGAVAGLVRELERAGRIERARGRLWPR